MLRSSAVFAPTSLSVLLWTLLPVPAAAAPMQAAQVIMVLNHTVDWYRTLGLQHQVANEPSDLLILYDNRQIANKVMATQALAQVLSSAAAAAQGIARR